MKKTLINALVVSCMMYLVFPFYGFASEMEKPILHVRRGNVDISEIVNNLLPDISSVDRVIAEKKTIDGYGDNIG